MERLYTLGLREAAQRLRSGSLAAAALMRSQLSRMHALEPAIQAWQHLDAARAMACAEAADASLAAGTPPGPLHGIPIAVKDILDVEGMPTTCGSPIFAGNMPAETARCVRQLESAGAIVVGKSVTTEFAYFSPGKTRNPWNVGHTPGGSSSGSAAAVAARMVMGALGTQTNGSVIRPAAFCGVVGFKPSYGVTSNHGTLDPWPTLDHTGAMARSVADVALIAANLVDPATPISAIPDMPTAAPRLVAVRSPVWHLATVPMDAAFKAAMATLRAAGAGVEEVELPATFGGAHAAMRTIMAVEAARFFRELHARSGDRLSERLRELIDAGMAVSAAQYDDALALRAELQRTFESFMAGRDAVITPPTAGEAPATLAQTGGPEFCSIWSLIGVPAVTVPVGLGPQDLPLGLQIVARHRCDDLALGVAAWCEARMPFHHAPAG